MRLFGVNLLLLLCCSTLWAQNFGELQKEQFGKGLYKVQSGEHYGIFDSNDNVIVSVEYENILLSLDRIAVLRKSDGCVYGSVTETGEVSFYKKPYKFHDHYLFYSEGYLPVKNVKGSSKEKWFYVDEKGEPLKKKVGGIDFTLTFKSVMPFNEGYASVITAKGDVLHMDKAGQERFIIDNEDVLFRSSVKDGEAVIVTQSGVKLYQEDKLSNKANLKMSISPSASYKVARTVLKEMTLEFRDGVLYLDYSGCPTKYVRKNGDPIVFGHQEKVIKKETNLIDTLKITPEPIHFDIKDELSVSLKHKVVSASSKGWAGITILMQNNSKLSTGNLTVKVKSEGLKPKESIISIPPTETQSVKVSLPAQFSEPQKNQTVIVEITDGKDVIEERFNVVLKRYEATSIL